MTVQQFCNRAGLTVRVRSGKDGGAWFCCANDVWGVPYVEISESFDVDREVPYGMARVLLRWNSMAWLFSRQTADILRAVVAEHELSDATCGEAL